LCVLHREYVGVRRGVCGACGVELRRAHPEGISHLASWPRRWCTGHVCSRFKATSTSCSRSSGAAEPRTDHRGELGKSPSHRGTEDRSVRDRRRAGRRAGRALHPGGQRGQYHRILAGLSAIQGFGPCHQAAAHARLPGCRCCPDRAGASGGDPETIATAIRIGNPASWYSATAAASESGGSITAVTDDEILGAYTFLAQEESIFCEAASAASVAGLLKIGVPKDSTVVCVLTGTG